MLFHSTVLANGLRVLVVEKPETLVTSVGVFIRHGSRNELKEESGLSHFLEHLIFNNQRAIRRGKEAVKEIVNNGGLLNAHTTKECTSFEGLILSQHSKTLLKALYELTFEADFTEEDVEAERKIILAELQRKLHSSEQIMDRLIEGMYGGHGYGNWILGNEQTIKSFSAKHLLQRYQEIYSADNSVIVIITNNNINDVINDASEIYSNVPSGVPTPIEIRSSESVHFNILKQKSDYVTLCMGGVGPSLRDEGKKNFEVAIKGWGGFPNSRLMLKAREKEGLVYHIQSFYQGFIQTGNWGIYTSVAKDKFSQLLDILIEEVNYIKENSLDSSEVNNAISGLKTDLYLKTQHQQYFLKIIGRNEIFRETIYPNDLVRQFELSTVENIKGFLNEYIDPLRLSMVVMGDVDGQKLLQQVDKMG
ncbi:M16 family metallopeptidase [Bacillus suaedaesalsae]|uniref:Insulinase family protein n=1 Tax=Bacillus suaedaesalsae TaxID=2810349 RepID=A0ABS2DKV3_9BACI|nr:pitrilysin family protein [Bacillus suaedaesalsae]MBM6619127.1 insulinase family protein [Bacillus suaedaesalsae]